MKTLLVVSILLSSTVLPAIPLASAHGVCGGLQSTYVHTLYPTLSKQSVKTGEDFTITGNVTAFTGNDLKGQLLLQTEQGSNGRFVITSVTPTGGMLDIPGNSVIPYSITVKPLLPGNYYVAAGINLVGIDKSLINNGCPTAPDIAVTGTPMCAQGMVAVSKAEDGSIFCIKSGDAQNIVQRGWASKIVPSVPIAETLQEGNKTSSDALKLLLSTNSTVIKPNQTLGIDITLNNTSSSVLVKDAQNNWPMQGLSMGPCQFDPVGVGVYGGNYAIENITNARPLQLYQNGTYNCPAFAGIDRYIFEPSGDKAVLENSNGNSTGEVKYHTSFDGFYTGNGFVPPDVGVYTILADDEWGHLAIQHFTVALTQNVSAVSNLIPVINTNFTINYNLTGNNKLLDANMSKQSNSLILSLGTTSNGTLTVSIPRTLLDSKSAYSNQDTQFIILVDKQEVKYIETTSIDARTLTIPFELGAKKIEITAPVNI